MGKLKIIRPLDISMPRMRVSIGEKNFSMNYNSSVEIDLPEGIYPLNVSCGGYSTSTYVNTKGIQRILISSIVPLWVYSFFIVCFAIPFVLYLLGVVPAIYWAIILLMISISLFVIAIVNKKRYFKIITE